MSLRQGFYRSQLPLISSLNCVITESIADSQIQGSCFKMSRFGMRSRLELAKKLCLTQGHGLHPASDIVGRVHVSDCASVLRAVEDSVFPHRMIASLFQSIVFQWNAKFCSFGATSTACIVVSFAQRWYLVICCTLCSVDFLIGGFWLKLPLLLRTSSSLLELFDCNQAATKSSFNFLVRVSWSSGLLVFSQPKSTWN